MICYKKTKVDDEMKESKYNFFYDLDDQDQLLAYNSLTNALAILEREKYNQLPSILAGHLEGVDEKYLYDLKYGGFVIDDDVDELAILRLKMLNSRFDRSYLSLTLAPTLGCNFDCIYCYETDQNDFYKMDDSVQEAVVNILEKQAPQLRNFSVTWYGGEPLLAFDVIESLTKRFMEVCEKHQIKYSAGIVTNGYLLTRDIAEKFKDLGIHFIQITLDGPEEIHDQRRYRKGGQPTYKTILKNIKDNMDILSVNLRINTDKTNAPEVDKVLKDLKEINAQGKVIPYLGYVDSTNDQYDKDLCLLPTDFEDIKNNFLQKLLENSFIKDLKNEYPLFVSNCSADHINSYVIGPRGDLYMCWNDIGLKEFCVGSILSEKPLTTNGFTHALKYVIFDPTLDEMCKDCKVLPICMGSCPYQRVHYSRPHCITLRTTLEKFMKRMAREFEHSESETEPALTC